MIPRLRHPIASPVAAFLILGGLAFVVERTARALGAVGYVWKWDRIPEFLLHRDSATGAWRAGLLLQGLWMTLKLSLASIALSLAAGVVVGLARVVEEPVSRAASRIYVEIARDTPLVVQIYTVYFLVGTAFRMTPFQAGVVALTFFTAAYVAEIVRGGVESIDRGQAEAARALGLSWTATMIHVVLPQAVRRMVAPLAGQFISLVKDSSLVSVVALTELTLAARSLAGSTYITMEIWLTVAALYFALTFPLSLASRALERRFSR